MHDGTLGKPNNMIEPKQPLAPSTTHEILLRNKEFRAAFEHVESILRCADITPNETHNNGEIVIQLGTALPIWIPLGLVRIYRDSEWTVHCYEEQPHTLIFSFYTF